MQTTDLYAVFEIMAGYTDICIALKAGHMPAEFWSRVEQAAQQCNIAVRDVSISINDKQMCPECTLVQPPAAVVFSCQKNTSVLFI
jgi:hypothetical protein